MADDHFFAMYEQFIIESEIRRTHWALRLQRCYDRLNRSDDLVRDSKHRLTICREDLQGCGKRRGG